MIAHPLLHLIHGYIPAARASQVLPVQVDVHRISSKEFHAYPVCIADYGDRSFRVPGTRLVDETQCIWQPGLTLQEYVDRLVSAIGAFTATKRLVYVFGADSVRGGIR